MVNKKVGDKVSMRKDFEVFGRGVERLEELRAELNALKVKGHDAEVLSIRAKLKNVSEIPNIERELKMLKVKISGKYKVKKKRGKSKVDLKIMALRRELVKKTTASKTAALRNDQKIAEQIPLIKSELISLKKELGRQKQEEERKKEMLKRIDPSIDLMTNEAFGLSLNEIKGELSDRIKNKEAAIQKRLNEDLAVREKIFKKKYNEMEERQHRLYAERVQKQLKKEVQSKFNVLLKGELKRKKAVLSKKELRVLKIRAKKEFEVGKEKLRKKLIKDLASEKVRMRKHFEEESLLHKHDLHKEFEKEIAKEVRKLKKEHRDLEREREIRLRGKVSEVEKELRKKREVLAEGEVKVRSKLRELEIAKAKAKAVEVTKFNEEKLKLQGEMAEEQKREADIFRKKLKERKILRAEFEKKLSTGLSEMRAVSDRKLEKGMRSLEEKRKVLSREEKREQRERARLAEKQRKLQEEGKAERAKIEKLGKLKLQEISLKEEEMRQRLEGEKDRQIHETMKKRTEELRGQFKKEFEERLKFELRKKDAELEQKKIEIEQEIQRKAKILFG